jgi:hypothetical protein
VFKFLKNFKENKQLQQEFELALELQKRAKKMIDKYDKLNFDALDGLQRAKSLAHFHQTRVEELEAKLKIYEELILKGNLK